MNLNKARRKLVEHNGTMLARRYPLRHGAIEVGIRAMWFIEKLRGEGRISEANIRYIEDGVYKNFRDVIKDVLEG